MALTEKGGARRRSRTEVLERPEYGWIWKPLLALLVIYLVVCLGLGIWWSRTPGSFDVEQAVTEQRGEGAGSSAARGAVTTAGLMTLIETLLEKPGGYLRNDIAPPGLWLDNMPAWELGVLSQARRLSRSLPAMEQSSAPVLEGVQERLMGDSRDWLYPSTEKRLEQALEELDGYLDSLGEGGGAAFGDQGQGLAAWLESVTGALDDLGLRLSASIGSRDELRDLDIDADALPARTPWYRVDNVFFEARGQAWALMHLLEAVRRDQADVLASAGVTEHWELLVAELERSQRRLWSPVVLNGSGFGIFANHSLVLANHMVRARDLAREVTEGLAAVTPTPAPTASEPPVVEVERSEDAAEEAPADEGEGEMPASSEEEPLEEAATDEGEEAMAAPDNDDGTEAQAVDEQAGDSGEGEMTSPGGEQTPAEAAEEGSDEASSDDATATGGEQMPAEAAEDGSDDASSDDATATDGEQMPSDAAKEGSEDASADEDVTAEDGQPAN
ncbi:DUF2333 family protein [Halomonas sp. LR5S13]|uniref:DUF2333 family protein n=1 Tax=Halomonas rhizosphaerae TaxID=3043296 RepID=UPI0024A93C71|nr:DUF2333 family protein [Halomonas rhizosphaerae]MDI5921922.1 DUF2333 family protein [Halomonas rhizosphaerae]